jgi:hypothetical protein
VGWKPIDRDSTLPMAIDTARKTVPQGRALTVWVWGWRLPR